MWWLTSLDWKVKQFIDSLKVNSIFRYTVLSNVIHQYCSASSASYFLIRFSRLFVVFFFNNSLLALIDLPPCKRQREAYCFHIVCIYTLWNYCQIGTNVPWDSRMDLNRFWWWKVKITMVGAVLTLWTQNRSETLVTCSRSKHFLISFRCTITFNFLVSIESIVISPNLDRSLV